MPRWQRVVGALVVTDVLLAVLYYLSQRILLVHSGEITVGLARMLDFHAEANLPTWWASSQLLLVAALALLIALQLDAGPLRHFYLLLALGFVFFSMDEAATIHEAISGLSKEISLATFLPEGHGAWMFVYPVVALVVLVVMRKGLIQFLKSPSGRLAFIVGGAVWILGGVGAELIGYYAGESMTEVIFEEFAELLGVTLMAGALLLRLQETVAWAAERAGSPQDQPGLRPVCSGAEPTAGACGERGGAGPLGVALRGPVSKDV